MSVDLLKTDRPWTKFGQDLLNIPEAAEILRLSPFTVRLFIARGELPIIKLGRRVLIHRDDLKKFVEERRGIRGPWKSKRLAELM